jgi:RNA polymerase sigma-70 factor (ECF subfamily)
MDASQLDFQGIYVDYQPRIQRYLTRLVGESEAEDLTQEVFIKASQGLAGFRGQSQLSTWLYRIATNAAIDRLRSPSYQSQSAALLSFPDETDQQTEIELEDQDLWSGEKKPPVEKELVRKYMNECVMGFIQKLPDGYRTTLVLSELEGLSNKEIAEILGVTLDTVKIRLHRAREKLREDLLNHCEYYWADEMPW